MNEEEKKAIENVKGFTIIFETDNGADFEATSLVQKEIAMDLKTILNLIEKQQNKIENAKIYLEYYLTGNNKYENAQKEFKKLVMMLGGD